MGSVSRRIKKNAANGVKNGAYREDSYIKGLVNKYSSKLKLNKKKK